MKHETNYRPGNYIITNPHGAKTPVVVHTDGLVYGVNGAPTGQPVEHYITNGCTVEPVTRFGGTLAHADITKLAVVNTTRITQLNLAIDHWHKQKGAAQFQTKLAWALYGDACDDPTSTMDEKNHLYGLAVMFETIAHEAWAQWQTAKQNRLAVNN